MVKKFFLLVFLALGIGLFTQSAGLTLQQSMALSIFSASIMGTLFFWDFRLSFAFIGTSLLLITKTIDIEHLILYSSLEVILFLVGMMVLVGLLKENGLFSWITQLLIGFRHLTAKKFVIVLSFASALLACAVDEVTSIIFMLAAVFEICDYLDIDPVPFIIISVLATNIGSAATVLGNPIGILIASKSGLTFEDFIVKAFPLSMFCLIVAILICFAWFKKPIQQMDENLKKFYKNKTIKGTLNTPFTKDLKISLIIFVATLFFISLHHRLEILWNLQKNTILLIMPLISSGIVMIWKHHQARKYIEHDVEWWTLLFFLLLFAQAGTLQYTGATDHIASKLSTLAGSSKFLLVGITIWIASIGSSLLDNVVLVAAMIPVIQGFKAFSIDLQPLWWALLFGGCLGGNITLVGSTANIVALGILEKEKNIRISFIRWFGIGLTVGIITTLIAWLTIVFIPAYH